MQSEIDSIDGYADSLIWIVLASFLFLSPVITAGSMLPFWMFINSLQIISHMLLLKTLMPANAHYFLRKWNNWMRWYDVDFQEHLQESYNFKTYSEDTGAYSSEL